MELVRGIPITAFCDQNQLPVRKRLELFVSICQAVQHAHQKGVIHRDLKPSNILVTWHDDKPVAKVIDFGIAKATGPQLTEKTLFTNFAQLIGTPLYMSPEQAQLNGLDIDTRTDIYSLGVLLYELLTATTPFDQERLRTAGYDEMRRIIREEEPVRPSMRISTLGPAAATVSGNRQSDPRRLSQLLRGELDWVVMKCLEKDRNRRYETANALAADVQRYLHDEPVQACPPSASYRLRKFARRNRGPVLAACLVVLALVFGIFGTTLALLEARRQREAAEANAARASKAQERAEQGFIKAKEAVEYYLTAVTADPDLKHKHDLHSLRKKLLDAAVPFYEWFIRQNPGDAMSEAERGRAYWRLADVRSEMGEEEAALKGYESTLAIFAKLATDFPTAPQHRENLAAIHNNRGVLLSRLEQRRAAEQAYRQALDIQEKLAADFPNAPEYRRALARSHNNLGNLLRELGQFPAAEQALRRALEIRAQLAADFPTMPEYREELSSSHHNLGVLLSELDQWPAAEQADRRALELRKKLAADFPAVPRYRQDLASSHHSLGVVLSALGQRPAAEQAHRRALEIQEKLVADFPNVPQYRLELASSHHSVGELLRGLGQRPAAEQAYGRALEIQKKLAADFPSAPRYREELARSYNSLGHLKARDQGPAAEQAYRRAVELREQLVADCPAVPRYRVELAGTHAFLGILLSALGQRLAAEQAYRRDQEIQEKLVSDFPSLPKLRSELAGSYVIFGIHLRDQGEAEASLAWFAKAIALLEPLVQQEPRPLTEHRYLRNAHWNRAEALDKLARHADAVKDWDRVLALNAEPAQEPLIRRGRAQCLARAGEHAQAVAEANALTEAKDVTGDTLYGVARVYALAAAKVTGDPRPRLADAYAARAVELLRQAVAKGYKNAAHLKQDKDLDALRGRQDFTELVAKLGAAKEKK
jgi:tetratricopeptide (TPR) repeat protein